MSYIDTSVIVSALDPLDDNNKKARDTLAINNKFVTELTLLELASIIARKGISIRDRIKVKDDKLLVIAILLYILRRFKLRYVGINTSIKIPSLGEFYYPFGLGLSLSRLRLRSLDLLHIAYAKILKDKHMIDSFITTDKEFNKIKDLDISIEVIK